MTITKKVHDQLSDVQERIGALLELPMANDPVQTALKAEWQEAFDALRAAGLESDADDPIAARYRAASSAVNHANRKRELANPDLHRQLDEIRQALGSIAFDLGMAGYDTENRVEILAIPDEHIGADLIIEFGDGADTDTITRLLGHMADREDGHVVQANGRMARMVDVCPEGHWSLLVQPLVEAGAELVADGEPVELWFRGVPDGGNNDDEPVRLHVF